MNQEVRDEINISSVTALDLVSTMAEGNPGAVTVLVDLLKQPNGELLVFGLDDMNIRGTQIWVGYKNYCDCNVNKFVACISIRDHGMVEAINKEGLKGNHIHKAVSSGATFNREFLKQEQKKEEPKESFRLIRL